MILPFDRVEFPDPTNLKSSALVRLENLLQDISDDTALLKFKQFELFVKDLKTLASPNHGLNDNVINYYLALVTTRLQQVHGLKVAAITSQIEIILRGDDRPHSKEIDPFNYQHLVIPLHRPGHWVGIGVDIQEHTIIVGDSMDGSYLTETKRLVKWLKDLFKLKYGRDDLQDWKISKAECPQQKPGSLDCGVFTLLFCQLFLLKKIGSPLYDQSQIEDYRKLFSVHIVDSLRFLKLGRIPSRIEYLLAEQVIQNPGLTMVQLYDIVSSLRPTSLAEIGMNNFSWDQFRRIITRSSLFAIEKDATAKRIFLKTYSTTVRKYLDKKEPIWCRYSTPLNAEEHTLLEALLSILDRYQNFSQKEICHHLRHEGYIKKRLDHDRCYAKLGYLIAKKKVIRQGSRPVRYNLATNVEIKLFITQEQYDNGARLRKVCGRDSLVIPSDAQSNFLKLSTSCVEGVGVYSLWNLPSDTLFEVEVIPAELPTDKTRPEPFTFSFNDPVVGRHTVSALNNGKVTSLIANANDAGVSCSQLMPVVVAHSNKAYTFYWKLRKSVETGEELFCAYNLGTSFGNSHWNFEYHHVMWLAPDSINPVDVHRMTAERRAHVVIESASVIRLPKKKIEYSSSSEESVNEKPREKRTPKRKEVARKNQSRSKRQKEEDEEDSDFDPFLGPGSVPRTDWTVTNPWKFAHPAKDPNKV